MRLYHTTPRKNLTSILQSGITPTMSKGKAPIVWLHTLTRTGWAYAHLSKHHECFDFITFEVEISRSQLTRRRRGIWTTDSPVIGNFTEIYDTSELLEFGRDYPLEPPDNGYDPALDVEVDPIVYDRDYPTDFPY